MPKFRTYMPVLGWAFRLIGLMLLVAAKQGKSLSGQLEQFV